MLECGKNLLGRVENNIINGYLQKPEILLILILV